MQSPTNSSPDARVHARPRPISTACSGSGDVVGSLVFIDTSILTNFFDVPNKNSDRATVVKEFEQRRQAGATFVLPVTSIIETGNHIAQLNGNARRTCAQRFIRALELAVEENPPWV